MKVTDADVCAVARQVKRPTQACTENAPEFLRRRRVFDEGVNAALTALRQVAAGEQ